MSTFAVSPDRAHLALTAGGLVWNELLITAPDGSGGRTVAGRHENDVVNGVAWSPDAHTLAFGRVNYKTLDSQIMTAATEGGPERALTHSNLSWLISNLQWLQDDWLAVLSSPKNDEAGSQIWRVSYPTGHTARITNDFEHVHRAECYPGGECHRHRTNRHFMQLVDIASRPVRYRAPDYLRTEQA
jgi:dipeptidyl aminopeptidase/acylaminoacyl peptidase